MTEVAGIVETVRECYVLYRLAALIEALERKVQQIEGMQAQLAHSKAQLLGVIEAVRAQPEGVPCSMGQKQVLASIKIGA